MRAYAVLSAVSSRLAAISSILRQASGRRPAPRSPSGHQADAAPHPPDARLAKAPRPGAMSLPGWPWRTPWRRPRGLNRVMGGSIWRLLAAASMALAATAASAVDVNSATVQQLESVSGIGPSTARTIVQERERAGAFESLDDLAERAASARRRPRRCRPPGRWAAPTAPRRMPRKAPPRRRARAARRLARPSPPRVGPPRRPGSKPCRPSRSRA